MNVGYVDIINFFFYLENTVFINRSDNIYLY